MQYLMDCTNILKFDNDTKNHYKYFQQQFVKLNYRYKFSYKTNYEHNSAKRQIQWSPPNPK